MQPIAKDYLSNGMADLAVAATGEAAHSMLEFIPLREEELMLVLPSSHPLVSSFEKEGLIFHCFSMNPSF